MQELFDTLPHRTFATYFSDAFRHIPKLFFTSVLTLLETNTASLHFATGISTRRTTALNNSIQPLLHYHSAFLTRDDTQLPPLPNALLPPFLENPSRARSPTTTMRIQILTLFFAFLHATVLAAPAPEPKGGGGRSGGFGRLTSSSGFKSGGFGLSSGFKSGGSSSSSSSGFKSGGSSPSSSSGFRSGGSSSSGYKSGSSGSSSGSKLGAVGLLGFLFGAGAGSHHHDHYYGDGFSSGGEKSRGVATIAVVLGVGCGIAAIAGGGLV
jgi:hypothetical protein